MKIVPRYLQTLLDPLGLEASRNFRFVRIAYVVTIVVFVLEAVTELALPILILYQLFR